jgi:predicted CoA-binding protein
MAHENPPLDVLRRLLTESKTIAMVGASSKRDRASYGVMKKMLGAGYDVIPVNPNESEVLGRTAYPTLGAVASPVDIVNVFRRPEYTPELADEAARIGAKALWLQMGVVNEEAARRAKDKGLLVVMDDCIGVTHSLLRLPKNSGVASR